jgi:hypothetical protein
MLEPSLDSEADTPMILPVATVAAVILLFLSALHVYWAFGGDLGRLAVIPEIHGERAFNPSPAATLMVAAALFAAALVVLGRAGVYAPVLSPALFKWPALLLALVFTARAIGDLRLVGFLKRIRDTPFARWDTALFSPLCLGLGAAIGWLSLR